MDFFSNNKKVVSGISARPSGDMRLGGKTANANRQKFFGSKQLENFAIASADLCHGNFVATVAEPRNQVYSKTDALITNVAKIILSVTVADCVPVYFYDPKQGAVGIAHGGWRGLGQNILTNTIQAMVKLYNSKPNDILAVVGPHICAKHYEVKADVAKNFENIPLAIIRHKGKEFLDLSQVVRVQLGQAGLEQSNIDFKNECTFDNTNYFSYRRDKPSEVEAQLAYIALIQ